MDTTTATTDPATRSLEIGLGLLDQSLTSPVYVEDGETYSGPGAALVASIFLAIPVREAEFRYTGGTVTIRYTDKSGLKGTYVVPNSQRRTDQ